MLASPHRKNFGCYGSLHKASNFDRSFGIALAQDRNRWRALGNAAMNFVFHKIRGIS